jgi:hypothetical protein
VAKKKGMDWDRIERTHRELKKRIGRPTKPPKEGERVALGLRVTPRMKRWLEEAATKNGRSLSQEAEFRLDMSLSSDRQLILAYGGHWATVIGHQGDLLIALPIGWDFESETVDEDLVPLKISSSNLQRLRNFFTGAPPPYHKSWRELEQDDEEASREIQIAEQGHEARAAKRRRKST